MGVRVGPVPSSYTDNCHASALASESPQTHPSLGRETGEKMANTSCLLNSLDAMLLDKKARLSAEDEDAATGLQE